MIRVYHKYDQWEDWQSGMYAFSVNDEERQIAAAFSLLADPERLARTMRRAVAEWPVACEVNLSNVGRNRQAWIGQAACCLEAGAPWHVTVQAWRSLSAEQQEAANRVADDVISEWQSRFEERCQSAQSELTF